VAALRGAGAVILGKTVTTELATLTPSATRNPVNLAHTPGGSSAGSAAAVACGMVPAALATQTGGSVIRPASYCGIYALKPTFGLISRTGTLLQSSSLDTLGVYGRGIDDLGLLADALSAHDPQDEASYPRSQPSLLAMSREKPPLDPVFCYVRSPALDDAEPVARQAFGELLDALGHRCEALDLAMHADLIAAWRTVQAAENAAFYGEYLDDSPALLSAGLRRHLEDGGRIPARRYLDALEQRRRSLRVIEDVLTSYNAILTPAATGPAPAGLASTGNPVFSGPWTLLGCPTVSLPLLDIDGLPLGVQLIGLPRDDGRLLRTARWLVEHLAALA
jgi:Asp-tRNA(Asn)/Glu-tRNA(Gln) amidotransferase A subunit family amidase